MKITVLLVTKLFQPHLHHNYLVPTLVIVSFRASCIFVSCPYCYFYVSCYTIVCHVSTSNCHGFFLFSSLSSYCKCITLFTYILLLKLSYEVPYLQNYEFVSPDCISGACSPTPSKSSSDTAMETPQPKKAIRSTKSLASSSSSSITSQKNSSIRFRRTKSNVTSSCKLDFRKSPDAKAKHTVSQASSLEVACEEQKSQNFRVQGSVDSVSCSSSNSEAKSTLFNRPPDEKFHRYGNSQFGSRVIPLFEDYNDNMDVPAEDINEDAFLSHREYENFCSVSKQLVQIENQQSSLLDLLQVHFSSPSLSSASNIIFNFWSAFS